MVITTYLQYQELYFEVQRKKQHLMIQARENWTANDLKKIIEGILKVYSKRNTKAQYKFLGSTRKTITV
jgi:hypothetical protein